MAIVRVEDEQKVVYAGPALAFWRPYANKNLAAPDHHESVNHKSQSVTVVTIES